MRYCKRCGCKIEVGGLGNLIKHVGKEGGIHWIVRHIRQLFSLIVSGFVKPEIEGAIELCDGCYGGFLRWLQIETVKDLREISSPTNDQHS